MNMKQTRRGKRIPTSVRRNRLLKAVSAAALSAVLILQALQFNLSFEAEAATSATVHTSGVQDDLIVSIDKTLTDLGSRFYRLRIEADAHIKDKYRTTSQKLSRDGVYVVEESGYYLIELWGGKGGNGDDVNGKSGGTGGSAGYVYGYQYFEAGQSFVFTSGTNGILDYSDNGGENHGGNTVATLVGVGGGGGYSAVYLFNTVKTSSTITEQERLHNYILIAGGGGGGGAANGNLYSDQQTGTPNGGNGGNVLSSASGHLNANDNNGVAGTFYAGTNGKSSGSKTSYIGKGATNIPGALADTFLGTSVTWLPQDWTGTYQDSWYATHTDNDGNPYRKSTAGSGGNGAMRGGSGGAGFAGGSGGSQSAMLIPINIGGGGGGSSFIADSLISTGIPASVSNYLEGFGGNPSSVGGSCIITYLGGDTGSIDTTFMQSVSLTGKLSKYFEVMSITPKNTLNNADNGSLVYDEETGSVSITGINIAPDASGNTSNTLRLDIIIRAKADFAGGNKVPVITEAFVLEPSGHDPIEVMVDASTDYCNVPLNFKAIGRSYTSNEPGKTYAFSELYVDNYESVRSNIGSMWQYDFISSIGTYVVRNAADSSNISGSSVSPTVTTSYTVRFPVTVKSTAQAVVGTGITSSTTYIKDIAKIRIVQADAAGTLNGMDMDATKMLNHDGEHYLFETAINQKTESVFTPAGKTVTAAEESTWVVPADGWYYIQAWGANGGSSGKATARAHNNPSSRYTSSGGWSGGAGGYNGGFAYLEENDIVHYAAGAAGANSAAKEGTIASGTYDGVAVTTEGGKGGGYSYVAVQKHGTTGLTYLVVSGGGGGGGGAAAARITYFSETASGSSAPGYPSTAMTDSVDDMSVFNGGDGGKGSASFEARFLVHNVSASSGRRGSGGSNYVDPMFAAGLDTSGSGFTISNTAKTNAAKISKVKSGTAGKINITFVENYETRALAESLFGIEAAGTFARYFDLLDVELDTVATSDTEVRSKVTNADGSVTVTYTDNGEETAKYTYSTTENADGTTSFLVSNLTFSPEQLSESATSGGNAGFNISYQSGLKLRFVLAPKDGFLGGNDVPLLQYAETGADDTGMKIGQNGAWLWLNEKEISDYANVAIANILDETTLDAQDVTIMCGQSVNQATDMLTVNANPLDSISETWKKEFVTFVGPTTTTVAPTVTTEYSFTNRLTPVAAPTKAEVIPTVSDATFTKKAKVYVNYSVTYQLTNLEHEGPDVVEGGNGLDAQIAPVAGYLLPESITVKIGTATLTASNYTYNKNTGEISIPAARITDNVTIIANAQIITYHIYYTYENADGDTIDTEEHVAFPAGTVIAPEDLSTYNALVAAVVDKTGYTYTWTWGTEDGLPVSTMPARDVYVVGSYDPNPYNITVHYVKEDDGTEAAPDYTEVVRFNSDYNIVSPHVPGYAPKTPVVSGTLTTADNIEITVYYEKAGGYLTIYYLYDDTETEVDFGQGIANPYKQQIAVDDHYNVASPALTGYTPDTAVVEGDVDGDDVDNGIVVYVRYVPNRIQVTFNLNGGTLVSGETSRTVVYNNVYGFDPTKPEGEQYAELPVVFQNGYDFGGWFDENDVQVTDETIVSRTDDHELTAKWNVKTYQLTVYYNYADGNVAAPTSVTYWEFGANYSVDSPVIEGYTPQPDVVGVMGAGNKVIYVVYGINYYNISIKLIGPDGVTPLKNYYYGTGQTLTTTTNSYWQDYSASLAYGSTVPTKYLPALGSTTYTSESYLWRNGLEPDDEKNAEFYATYLHRSTYSASTASTSPTFNFVVPSHDVEIKIYYKYIDYTLTVNYISEETGFVNPGTHTETVHYGQSFSVPSPTVTGFTASSVSGPTTVSDFATTKTVTGTIWGTAETGDTNTNRNKTYTVTYTKNTYTLTIEYFYDPNDTELPDGIVGGSIAAPTHTDTLAYGAPYSVTSPVIDPFVCSQPVVEGTMPADNVYVAVYYSTAASDVYAISVDWGNLTFDYNPGTWDPTTHSYVTGTSTLTPRTDSVTGAKLNKITVTSSDQTTKNVVLAYSYEQLTGYEDFTASLWRNEEKFGIEFEYDQGETVSLAPNHSESVWLFLEGESDSVSKGQLYHVGNCTVTITAAP